MIPNDVIKRMLFDCIEGKAQSEIVLLRPDGLAFKNYGICEFFQELLKKFMRRTRRAGRWSIWKGGGPETRMLISVAGYSSWI